MAFTPRLNSNGILGNFHWYSGNPFYTSGYGMPNCTCYAWGRFWEIGDPLGDGSNRPTGLPTSDGGSWFGDAIASGNYQVGQTPQLGAVACFHDDSGGSGHVAIVEEIHPDGTIVTSNSAWQSTYFYTQTLSSSNNYAWSHYSFQGFIYNPFGGGTPTPPPTKKKHHFNFVLFDKRRRDRKYYEQR